MDQGRIRMEGKGREIGTVVVTVAVTVAVMSART